MQDEDVREVLESCRDRVVSIGFKSCGTGPRLSERTLQYVMHGGFHKLTHLSFDVDSDARTGQLYQEATARYLSVGV